jgi:hypothetical protein
MNDKIKDIAIEINPASKEIYNGEWEYNCAAWSGEELTKFAERIVNECIEIVNVSGKQCTVTTFDVSLANCVRVDAVKKIRENFNLKGNFNDYDQKMDGISRLSYNGRY